MSSWDDERAERAEACDGRNGTCVTPPDKCNDCRWGELATYEDPDKKAAIRTLGHLDGLYLKSPKAAEAMSDQDALLYLRGYADGAWERALLDARVRARKDPPKFKGAPCSFCAEKRARFGVYTDAPCPHSEVQ